MTPEIMGITAMAGAGEMPADLLADLCEQATGDPAPALEADFPAYLTLCLRKQPDILSHFFVTVMFFGADAFPFWEKCMPLATTKVQRGAVVTAHANWWLELAYRVQVVPFEIAPWIADLAKQIQAQLGLPGPEKLRAA